MTEFRNHIDEFRDLNAQVLAISVDSPFSHKAFADQLNLNFPLLSDFNREVIPEYGVEMPELLGLKRLAKRSQSAGGAASRARCSRPTEDPSRVAEAGRGSR